MVLQVGEWATCGRYSVYIMPWVCMSALGQNVPHHGEGNSTESCRPFHGQPTDRQAQIVFHGFTTGALKVKTRVADSEQGCRKPARKGTKGLCGLASGLDVRDAVAVESEAGHVYAVMSLPLICKSNPLMYLT